VKEIRKRKKPPFVRRSSKAKNRRKHQPVYVVLQNPDQNAIAVVKQDQNAKCAGELLQAEYFKLF
jgi:hypothetical protein